MRKWYLNRWLVVLLCFGIIIPQGFHSNVTKVKAARIGTVTASTLNVRSEPSATAGKVQVNGINVYLIKGDTVNILEEKGDWYYASLQFNGITVKGYVHRDYINTPKPTVTPKPTATPKPTPTPISTSNTDTSSETMKKDVSLKASVTATTLNVRSGPGTNYAKVSGLVKGNSVTILNEVLNGSTKWYGISFKTLGTTKTGYVSSDFIKLSFTDTVKGETAVSKLKIRAVAGSKAAYLKDSKGNIISLAKKKAVTITDEKIVSNEKWFKISFTVDGKKQVGYALAEQISFRVLNAESTAVPTATPMPTATPAPTVTPTPSATITPDPTAVPTSAPSNTPTPTPTPTPSIPQALFEVPNIQIFTNIDTPRGGFVCNTINYILVKNILVSEELLYDSNNKPVTLSNAERVTVNNSVRVDGVTWYHITYKNNFNGYVRAEYIYVAEVLPDGITPPSNNSPAPNNDSPTSLDFEAKLTAQGFPESYKASLRQLNALYPKWEFKAYHTGLDWKTVIREESIPGKNLLPNNKSVEWKSLESGAYNWKTDTFIVFDGSTWVTASKAAVEYFMDPRNFLTANGIFQFELLRYQSDYQKLAGVENILKGTAMYKSSYSYLDENNNLQQYTYGETFIKAAQYSGVSPYHLASRVKQEVVTGPTTLSNSVSGTYTYNGENFTGFYNFYNIGANDSAGGGAVANGLRYAKNGSSNAKNNALYLIPWTSPFKSIVGGSQFLGGSYINRGQDTVYLQKFNVTPISTYFHQYMTNVEAPFAEAKKIYSAYGSMTDAPIVFSIPVYLNMPSKAIKAPNTMFNPNNRLKSIKVLSMSGEEFAITPTFNQTQMSYYLIVGNSIDVVDIKATTVSKKATLGGGGYIPLNVGSNEIIIPVIAENGDIAYYTINIVRE